MTAAMVNIPLSHNYDLSRRMCFLICTASNQYQQVSSAIPHQTDSGYGAAEFVNQYDKITPANEYHKMRMLDELDYLDAGELALENKLMSEYASARNADAHAALQANYDDLPQPSVNNH